MISAALEGALSRVPVKPPERVIDGGARGTVRMGDRTLINLASCDYLGLARDPRIVAAGSVALSEWGLGSAAARGLSGTTAAHRELERRLAAWVGCEDAVLHGSCWTANAAIFGALAQLDTPVTVFSDRLNHASIIDGVRAQRKALAGLVLYGHDDLTSLREGLAAAHGPAAIVTDGVFSMEGDLAPLDSLCALADEFDALLIVDDSHGTGVVGATGRGTAEGFDVLGRPDVVTGTLGKALGGAIGGFVAGPARLVSVVRSGSRPYLFSNNPPPAVVAGALAALDVLASDPSLRVTLDARVAQLRAGVEALGLHTYPGSHPIVPVVIGEEDETRALSGALAEAGVFAAALAFPIVPLGEARLRLQVSAAHSEAAIAEVLVALEAATAR